MVFLVNEAFPINYVMFLISILSSYDLTIVVYHRIRTVLAAAMVITHLT